MKSFYAWVIMTLLLSQGCKTTSGSHNDTTKNINNNDKKQEAQKNQEEKTQNKIQSPEVQEPNIPSSPIEALQTKQDLTKKPAINETEIYKNDAARFKKIQTIPLTSQFGKLVDSSDVHFIVLGDTGTGDENQKSVAQGVERICKKHRCDFGLLLGDNIYPSGPKSANDIQFKNKFEIPYKNLDFPFYVALGNHDQSSNDFGIGDEEENSQFSVDYAKLSNKWIMPKQYYAALGNGIRFLVLDTTPMIHETRLGTATPGAERLSEKAKIQMEEWAELMSQPLNGEAWNFVIGHHPYRSNGEHGNAGNFDPKTPINPWGRGKTFKDFFEKNFCGKTDMLLSGHVHSRQWLKSQNDPCQNTELVINGASGKSEDIPGTQENYFQKGTLGFIYIAIQGKTLTLNYYNQNGYLDFSRTITKHSNTTN